MQKEKQGYKKYFLYYSVIFMILAFMIYFTFIKNNKSFVYSLYGDGHICFNSLVYYGRWLRQILMTLVQDQQLIIPMWDMSVGYGSDILVTFNWMTLGDPLNLLAVFFSADNTEYLYCFLAIFRLYLAGVTFSVYSLYHKNDKVAVLGGSIIYAFCGFALFAGIRDVYFMSPMIYFPLLCMGVDKVFRKEKPYLFILITALSGVTNFYYFFVLSIWVFIYGIYRYCMVFGKEYLKPGKIVGWLFRCIGYYLLGVAMAAILLVPIIIQLLGSERFANQDYVPILYSFDYYWKLLVRFTTTESMEAWTHFGYAPICVITILVLFIKKDKKYTAYKIAFVMCMLFVMLPVVGSLMNAGSYVVNRWIWAFSMLVAYIFVKIYPELFQLNKKEKLIIILACCGYAIICMMRTEFRTVQLAVMMVILLASVLMLLLGDYLEQRQYFWKYLILGCVFLGVLANGVFRYAWFGSNYAAGFVDKGQAWNLIHNDLPSRELEGLADAWVVRYDSLGTLEPMYNTAMNHNLNGTDFYFSLADGNITRYFDDLAVNVEMEHRYNGVDERTILERLAGVKYCIAGNDSKAFVPYGYNTEIKVTDNYTIYENENTLPIGYTYDSYITYEEYEALSYVQRQQAILQCAIIEENEKNILLKGDPVYTDQELSYVLEGEEGIQLQEKQIIVSDQNALLKVRIDAIPESEIYLVWDEIIYEKAESTDQEQSDLVYTRDTSAKKQILYSNKHAFYHGRNDYIVNMGYNDSDQSMEITIQFGQPGVYSYEEFSVIAQPMTDIDDQTKALASESLQDIKVETNKISGTLSLSDDKLLCVAVPYSTGWKAYVDGEEAEIKCVNGVYNGVEVAAGEHEIVMEYQTPGVKAGLILAFAGLIGLSTITIWGRKRKKEDSL